MDITNDFKVSSDKFIRDVFWSKINLCTEEEIGKYQEKAYSQLKIDLSQKSVLDNQFIILYEDRIRKTKKRWYNIEMKEGSSLKKEVWLHAKEMSTLSGPSLLINTYGVSSLTELENKLLSQLIDWVQDKGSYLCFFRYINKKTKTQFNKALCNDLLLLLHKQYFEYFTSQENNISKIPEIMVGGKVVYTAGKGLLNILNNPDVTVTTNSEGKIVHQFEYIIDDNQVFRSGYDTETVKLAAFENFNLHSLRDIDVSIFNSLMSFKGLDFFSTKQITVPIADILDELNMDKQQAYYEIVFDSLRRMKQIQITIKTKNSGSEYTFNILNNLNFINPNDLKDNLLNKSPEDTSPDLISLDTNNPNIRKFIVQAEINSEIVNQIISKRTVNMYRDKLNSLKYDASRILLLRLERERITNYFKGETPNELKVDISFFRSIFLLTSKQTIRHYKLIEKALNEIKANNVTLKDYERIGDYFYLQFYPVTPKEKIELSIEGK